MSGSKNTKKTPRKQLGPNEIYQAVETAPVDENATQQTVKSLDEDLKPTDHDSADAVAPASPPSDNTSDEPSPPPLEIDQAVPPQSHNPRLRGLLGFVAAGACVALISFGAALYTSGNGPFQSKATELEARLAAQSQEISALKTRMAQQDNTAALQGLQAQMDVLRTIVTDLAALQVEIEQVSSAQNATAERLGGRLDDLENQLLRQSDISPASVADLAQQSAALTQVQNQIAEQQTALVELTAAFEQKQAETQSVAQQILTRGAVSQLIGTLESGAPFAFAIAGLQDFEDLLSPALVAAAPYGVPTAAVLSRAFPEQSRAALLAARTNDTPQTNGGNRVGDFLRNQLGMRSIAPRTGTDPDAVLSRAEAAVQAGQVSDALNELTALPKSAQTAMAGWIEQAKLRQAAQRAVATLSQRLQKD